MALCVRPILIAISSDDRLIVFERCSSNEFISRIRENYTERISCQPADRPSGPDRSPWARGSAYIHTRRFPGAGFLPPRGNLPYRNLCSRRYSYHSCANAQRLGSQEERHLSDSERYALSAEAGR